MKEYLTIEGFEKLPPQQLFDMSAAHIQETRQKSYSVEEKMCVYTGIGCAASVFLRPECRLKADEVGAWYTLAAEGMVPYHYMSLVIALQNTHDNCFSSSFMEEWLKGMRVVAERYGLNTGVLEA